MDDFAPKPPVKPDKAARRPVRNGTATPPSAPKAKAARKVVVPFMPPEAEPVTSHAAESVTSPKAEPVVPPVAEPTPVVASEPAPVVAPEPAPVPAPAPAPSAPVASPVAAPVNPDPIGSATTAPIPLTAAKEVIMETIENVTAKTQTAFADATAQAKGAVEKSQKMFEDANEFGKGNIEAVVESSKIAARGLEAMGQDAAAFAKKSFEEATLAAKTMTSVKSPTELLKLQSDYARSAFDAMVQQTSRNTEAMLKLAGEVVQPLSNRVALAAEKMKVVA